MALLAQFGNGVTVRISVLTPVSRTSHYFAQLDGAASQPFSRQLLQSDELTFENVPPGPYTLRIVDAAGSPVAQFPLVAGTSVSHLEVRLPESRVPAPPAGQVPYYRLLHPLDSATKREMLAATKALRDSDTSAAFQHLQNALQRNAYIPEAHGWEGALYLRESNLEAAGRELQTALEQGWKDSSLYVNLGLLNFLKHDHSAAEAFCRQALSTDPASPSAKRLTELLKMRH